MAVGVKRGQPAVMLPLRPDHGLAIRWTREEQAILDRGLLEYAAESIIVRYAKIAMQLPNKTIRDVALRVRWMDDHDTI